jgi:hypothetical protein
MKMFAKVGFAFLLTLGLASVAAAGDEVGDEVGNEVGNEVTLEGKMVCAKCHLKQSETCQNVLVVKTDDGKVEYYIAANEVAEKFGKVCEGEKMAKVTGTVEEKDGKKCLTASAIEEIEG